MVYTFSLYGWLFPFLLFFSNVKTESIVTIMYFRMDSSSVQSSPGTPIMSSTPVAGPSGWAKQMLCTIELGNHFPFRVPLFNYMVHIFFPLKQRVGQSKKKKGCAPKRIPAWARTDQWQSCTNCFCSFLVLFQCLNTFKFKLMKIKFYYIKLLVKHVKV